MSSARSSEDGHLIEQYVFVFFKDTKREKFGERREREGKAESEGTLILVCRAKLKWREKNTRIKNYP